ncbi:N-acetylglucosamine-6-phosphate deacetylase [Ureibacillus acetophenoni]|uniref:N-acetylglucosamine-6-phosphate deacetylase n=1 Tax=Ureibacillus acetophenoni TaxID=614649 RepID=A0A285U582_9BACL|nr:N-acetylglucosamine-6-phosphate deacetylase [Ureibacillus acetophenoni]SOC37104.1 N-acetylglucosamine 6-phosphate deacetylase [Ureibacillus acetophenoni]
MLGNKLIRNLRICLEDGSVIRGEMFIENGKISRISQTPIENYDGEEFDGKGNLALPGFIDQHIHGAIGADFMDGEYQATERIVHYLPSEGTTSFLATTMTHSQENIQNAINVNKQFTGNRSIKGAEMLGLHLEGPFIHPEQAGAQPLQYIRKPSIDMVKEWFGARLDGLKIVTLAPELDSNFEMIDFLNNNHVVSSAGHTIASFEVIQSAHQHGLNNLTHFTNAMTGIHHREIGVVGAGFMNNNLFCEVIADGVHLSAMMLKMIGKFIGADRIILITDSMRAKGLPDGTYTLADQDVTVVGQKATLRNGTLAGSVLRMIDGVKLMKELCDLSIHDIQKISSMNAAKQLGVFDRKGSLRVGKDADFILLNEDFEIQHTFCLGELSFSK